MLVRTVISTKCPQGGVRQKRVLEDCIFSKSSYHKEKSWVEVREVEKRKEVRKVVKKRGGERRLVSCR